MGADGLLLSLLPYFALFHLFLTFSFFLLVLWQEVRNSRTIMSGTDCLLSTSLRAAAFLSTSHSLSSCSLLLSGCLVQFVPFVE